MDEKKKQEIINELKVFYKELKAYKRRFDSEKQPTEAQKKYTQSLREQLVRKAGKLKYTIVQLTGLQHYSQFGRIQDFWAEGLSSDGYPPAISTSLSFCIDAANEAIGKIESTTFTGLQPVEKREEEARTDVTQLLIQLYDSMQFHPKVVKASRSLFETGHYSQAIFEAFKAVNNFVKEKSGLTPNEIRGMTDGRLMGKVFAVNNPVIKINELISDTDRSEQEGFKFLFMGATLGIRNPKAHDFIEMEDPYKTLEYLAFASLLLKKISFWTVD